MLLYLLAKQFGIDAGFHVARLAKEYRELPQEVRHEQARLDAWVLYTFPPYTEMAVWV
jgi:hypothetical protein